MAALLSEPRANIPKLYSADSDQDIPGEYTTPLQAQLSHLEWMNGTGTGTKVAQHFEILAVLGLDGGDSIARK